MNARLALCFCLTLPALGCGSATPSPGDADGSAFVDAYVEDAHVEDAHVDDAASATTEASAGSDAGARDARGPATDGGRDVDAWVAPGSDAGDSALGPDVPGAYTVMMSSTMLTGATAVAYVPTLPAGQRGPLVVFKHGFQLASADYSVLLQRIATHGFIVVGVDTASSLVGGPTNVDERDAIRHTIDWALGSAPFAGTIDGARIAVMGHSRGGKDAVLAAAADSRITAALLLDPVNGCGPGMGFSATCPDATSATNAGALSIPVGVMGETNDATGGFMPCAPAAENYATIYPALHASSWAVQWTFADAVHMTFTDDGGGLAGSFCAAAPADSATLRDNIHAMAVAFARYHLRGEASMAAWLTGASLPSGITRTGP